MEEYLTEHAQVIDEVCVHRQTQRPIRAAVPMHTFGHPVELNEIIAVCRKWNIALVEDAAESSGSFCKGKHTGTVGEFGAVSFNGNKIITTGGGGMVFCKTFELRLRTKHITTTAKIPHPYGFFHDEAGFNYRMPNFNAALGCAQMEFLDQFLVKKRELARQNNTFFSGSDFKFVLEPEYEQSNYWLSAVFCPSVDERNEILNQTNSAGIMTRPIWKLMHHLPMFKGAPRGDLPNSEYIKHI